jgi:hypothetical protein
MSHVLRSPENQKKHKKKLRILSVIVFLCASAVVWLIVWVPSVPSLQIKSIIVRGNKVLTEEEIKQEVRAELSGKYLHVFPQTNIFLYPKKMIEEGLSDTFPRISRVSAELDAERTLTIFIAEREPSALWCGREMVKTESDDTCLYLDDKGFVFAKAPRFSGNAYFEFYGKGVLPDGNPVGHDFLPLASYQHILKIKERLESFGGSPIKIVVADDGSAEFLEKSGYRIRFNIDEDISSLESNMQAVFHSNSWGNTARSGALEYLDFRFGNKVYYKYKNTETELVENTNDQIP